MDVTNRPFKISKEFLKYAEENNLFDLFTDLFQKIIIDKPLDPLLYIQEYMKDDLKLNIPKICIIGPPASGKCTVSNLLSFQLSAIHIDRTEILNNASTDFMKEINEYDAWDIPIDLWVRLLSDRLKYSDCVNNGYVLENIPSSLEECLLIQESGIIINNCIVLNTEDSVLVERSIGKRVDPITNDIYHLTFDPPRTMDVARRLIQPENNGIERIKERLEEYRKLEKKLKKYYKHIMSEFNVDMPKEDIFTKVLIHIHTFKKNISPLKPRILVLGPIGSGKKYQCELLANKYGFVNLSSGTLIKEEMCKRSDIGIACQNYVDNNKQIPDVLVNKIMDERLSRNDCIYKGWVLRGFPRNIDQALMLTEKGFNPTRVFMFDISKESILERLTLKRIDPLTGNKYHLLFNPPLDELVNDRLLTHLCDSSEYIFMKIDKYLNYIEVLKDLYKNIIQQINADQPANTIFELLESWIIKAIIKD
ncbi:hypothetical protein A3Q56_01675 [Intoshia linei]|uniref:Adenylate kinase 8 n=1 Tax=Intoshia linei TaxID=1819745 RepID=A0A177B8H1_9BILA|nr:hypothetical protein A3Q56_01675 [Intoshia linei]